MNGTTHDPLPGGADRKLLAGCFAFLALGLTVWLGWFVYQQTPWLWFVLAPDPPVLKLESTPVAALAFAKTPTPETVYSFQVPSPEEVAVALTQTAVVQAQPTATPQPRLTTMTSGHQPQLLFFSRRPEYFTELHPNDRAFLDYVEAGKLTYAPWQNPDARWVLKLTKQDLTCAVSVEALDGMWAAENLAKLATEGNAGKGSGYKESPSGALWAMQMLPTTFNLRTVLPFAGANIYDECDQMLAASNLSIHSGIDALAWNKEEYVYNFLGGQRNPGGSRNPGAHRQYSWNAHEGQAEATYDLAWSIYCARMHFWDPGNFPEPKCPSQ